MKILNGKEVSLKLSQELKNKINQSHEKYKRFPSLAVIQCGDYGPSQIYVKNKIKACHEVGIKSQSYNLPSHTLESELKDLIWQLNEDQNVDGILIQLPLPKHLDKELIINQVLPKKDVDGFTAHSLGQLINGSMWVRPCTPLGILRLMDYYNIPLKGARVAILGRSLIVGKPLSLMLTARDATVTLCHSETKDLIDITVNSDLVILATHKREFFGKQFFNNKAYVIDVGIHPKSEKVNKVTGDLNWADIQGHLQGATPVPGGVGPMTIYALLENTYKLFLLNQGVPQSEVFKP